MGSFPALPSGSNPYVGAAASAAGSAASIYNSARNRKAAAQQQAAQAAEKQRTDAATAAQRDEADKLAIIRAGGQLDTTAPYVPPPGRPTLMGTGPAAAAGAQGDGGAGSDAPPPKRPGQTITHGGETYYFPTEGEKEDAKLTDANSFVPTGQLGAALESAGRAPGKRMKPADSHSLMMALNEAMPKDEPWEIDTSGKFHDAQGNPAAVIIGKKTGKVRMLDLSALADSGGATAGAQPSGVATGGLGSALDAAQAGDESAIAPQPGGRSAASQAGVFELRPPAQQPAQPSQPVAAQPAGGPGFALPPKADKPPKYTVNHYVNDAGALTLTRIGAGDDATPEKWDGKNWVPLGAGEAIGPKKRDPDAAPRQKPATAASLRSIANAKKREEQAAFEEWRKNVKVAYKPDDISEANAALKKRLQANEETFAQDLGRAQHQDLEPSNWVDTFEPDPKSVIGSPARTNPELFKPAQPAPGRGGAPAQRTTASPAATPENAAPAVQEGTVIVNPKTKQRMTLKGGQWQPLPAQ
jgi:hypothetical protein